MWIDGVFMGMMFLTCYAAVIGDAEACFAEAAHQILERTQRLLQRCLRIDIMQIVDVNLDRWHGQSCAEIVADPGHRAHQRPGKATIS